MHKILLKDDGTLVSDNNIEGDYQYTCEKGTASLIQGLVIPVGVKFLDPAIIKGLKCPCCNQDIYLPAGKYSVADGMLINELD